MTKNWLVFFSVATISILLLPSVMMPIRAETQVGPSPISPSLIPPIIPGTVTTIVPQFPNLGTIDLGLPTQLYDIKQTKNGLVASDSLTNETRTLQQLLSSNGNGYWFYGGDALALGAPFDIFRDYQGLHNGVQAPSDGVWAGDYAMGKDANAEVFHAVITTPARVISNTTDPQWYENGLYVQRATLPVNYVSCFSLTGAWGTQWAVVSTTGNDYGVTNENLLWVDDSANQPLTRDCTIITNGDNYLKVYLDGNMVYTSNSLDLQMPKPFNAYLEPQSSYPGQLLKGIYKNYYVTTTESMKVTNNPIGASHVDLVIPNSSGSGTIVATAPVDSSGVATLNVGQFDMPLNAYIKVYGIGSIEMASTSTPINIFGGNEYSVNLLGGSILGIAGL